MFSRTNLIFLASKLCSEVIFITPQPIPIPIAPTETRCPDILPPATFMAAVLPKVYLLYRSCNRSFSVLLLHVVRLTFLIFIGCHVIAAVQILVFFFFETWPFNVNVFYYMVMVSFCRSNDIGNIVYLKKGIKWFHLWKIKFLIDFKSIVLNKKELCSYSIGDRYYMQEQHHRAYYLSTYAALLVCKFSHTHMLIQLSLFQNIFNFYINLS